MPALRLASSECFSVWVCGGVCTYVGLVAAVTGCSRTLLLTILALLCLSKGPGCVEGVCVDNSPCRRLGLVVACAFAPPSKLSPACLCLCLCLPACHMYIQLGWGRRALQDTGSQHEAVSRVVGPAGTRAAAVVWQPWPQHTDPKEQLVTTSTAVLMPLWGHPVYFTAEASRGDARQQHHLGGRTLGGGGSRGGMAWNTALPQQHSSMMRYIQGIPGGGGLWDVA
jgi:hypothetical protein